MTAALNKEHLLSLQQNISKFWEQKTETGYEFEQVDIQLWRDFLLETWTWPIYAAVIYLALIFGLERYMRNRPAYDLKTPLIWWNAGLGIFSIMGFVRMAPCLGRFMTGLGGLYDGVCTVDYTEQQMAFWGIAFGISKYIELGDTVFIVLRKRPLQLLQWYHHIATLIVVWISLPYAEPVGRWFIVMNYMVHSCMYPYFALKMAGIHVPKVISNTITTAQFTQMIVGFLLNVVTIGFKAAGFSCYRPNIPIWTCVTIYTTFVVLFGKLFMNSVVKTSGKKSTKTL